MEKNNTLILTLMALLVGGIVGYLIGSSHFGHSDHGNMMMGNYRNETGMENRMMGGMHDMHSMMVESEREFIEGMIPHHQEAVDTAKEVIARGATTPAIKSLVENIIIAQESEIADMKDWYQTWYNQSYVDNGEYQPMMRDLSNLSGSELDRVFLEDMIMHHMGAIMMARSVEPYIEHEEIKQLTDDIISSQTAEIELMRDMLKSL